MRERVGMQKVRVGLEKVQLGAADTGLGCGPGDADTSLLPRVTFRMLQRVTELGKGIEAGQGNRR